MASRTKTRINELLISIRDNFDDAAADLNIELAQCGVEPEAHTQTLAAPDPVANLPTLDASTFRPPTPMLEARFEFCGRWRRFYETWLSIRQMETVTRNRQFRNHFSAKRNHWDNSAPATIPPDRLSVFSVASHSDGDYSFLVWPASGVQEPELWRYSGQCETRFENLESFLLSALSGI